MKDFFGGPQNWSRDFKHFSLSLCNEKVFQLTSCLHRKSPILSFSFELRESVCVCVCVEYPKWTICSVALRPLVRGIQKKKIPIPLQEMIREAQQLLSLGLYSQAVSINYLVNQLESVLA